ncbi:diguanylate cyclase [uncultured Lamprocystis sp.]|jgi:two-component system chemotaxis response regulator CheY|uniref:GGDEF domain-containing response regulator n=1 Tax=uncultured Lamprocystis sp. TaxID=543132 RepID=UPI0025EB262A|nr:diguanylate cyclase [uncultured Lamprocystis sp.]
MKILVVEDQRFTRRMLVRFLTNAGYAVEEAQDGCEAMEVLAREPIRFVITDWMMPCMSGLELIRAIRGRSLDRWVYVILLTARDEKSGIVEALDAGADDFIHKPFDNEELAVRIRAGQRIIELTERLERLAMTDPLTGLLNRRGLQETLAQSGSADAPLGCVVADIDHFKRINDARGHDRGDLVLKQIAELLRGLFEPDGIVARVGGEEFWLLLRNGTPAELCERVERARSIIAATVLTDGGGDPLNLTLSFGITAVPALQGRDITTLFKIADGALYASKQNGRNRVTCAAPDACP